MCSSDLGEQKFLVIDAQRGNPGGSGSGHDIRGVEPPADTDFQDAGIGRIFGKGEQRGGGRCFEKCRLDIGAFIEHPGEQFGELFVGVQ